MNTAQIIIFIILGIIMIGSYFKLAYTIDTNKPIGYVYLFIYTLTTAIFFMIAILATQQVNELRTQVKNKCPEYEKIENVYKLKQ